MFKIILAIAGPLIAALWMWLWLGVANSLDPRIPALGFWASFFLTLALCAPVHLVTHRDD